VVAEGGVRLKMRAVKAVHHPKRVRSFNRYERLILASLTSAVLIISIIYMGSFPITALSGSGGSSNYFEVYIGNVTMTNVTMIGPRIYSSIEGPIEVTNVTADVANLSGMLLVKEGSKLELEAPGAFVTKLMVYTMHLIGFIPFDSLGKIECYGNGTVGVSFPSIILVDVYMKAVYLQAESFSAQGLNLTCT
jgi:hypothetical protein